MPKDAGEWYVHCPVCGHVCKAYVRQMTSRIARAVDWGPVGDMLTTILCEFECPSCRGLFRMDLERSEGSRRE